MACLKQMWLVIFMECVHLFVSQLTTRTGLPSAAYDGVVACVTAALNHMHGLALPCASGSRSLTALVAVPLLVTLRATRESVGK